MLTQAINVPRLGVDDDVGLVVVALPRTLFACAEFLNQMACSLRRRWQAEKLAARRSRTRPAPTPPGHNSRDLPYSYAILCAAFAAWHRQSAMLAFLYSIG